MGTGGGAADSAGACRGHHRASAQQGLHGFLEFVAQIGLERLIRIVACTALFFSTQSTRPFIRWRRPSCTDQLRNPSFKADLCHEL